ncbi:MAG: response regulator transcription factor [Anaerolineae bacterium]|nr:response regulator transcription factor [Anaerolineae bacterium]
MRDRVSILTDDRVLAESMRRSLEQAGLDVQVLPAAPRHWQRTRRFMSSLLLVDLESMGKEPLVQCRRLRAVTGASIMAVSQARDEETLVAAFESGVDEYVRKPVSEAEVAARVEAILRRVAKVGGDPRSHLPVCQGVMLDTANRILYVRGRRVRVSPIESRLLQCLVQHAGQVVSRETLLRQISCSEKRASVGLLTLYIHYLRRKIETDPRHPRYILTRWGVGYYLNMEERQSSRLS